MSSIIAYYLQHFILILAAPFYFHFGQYSFVSDFVSVLFEIVDIIALYYLQIFILIGLVFYRNALLKSLTALNLRYSLIKTNNFPLLNSFKINLTNIKCLLN
jgi:hypothetical protein